jgi:sphinganine C4-monooxygenase
MAIAVSDELLGTFVPIAVYWLYSGLYVALDGVGRLGSYRLHPKGEEAAKNVVSRAAVVRGVLVQQAFQVVVALALFTVIPPHPPPRRPFLLISPRHRCYGVLLCR